MLVQISMGMMMIQHHVMIQRMKISKTNFMKIKHCRKFISLDMVLDVQVK